jgi:hypothetical protein
MEPTINPVPAASGFIKKVALTLFVVLVIGGGIYYKIVSDIGYGTVNPTPGQRTSGEIFKGSPRDLVALGRPVSCITQSKSEPVTLEIFVAEGKIRQNFISPPFIKGGEISATYVISDMEKSVAWTWISGENRGVKTPIPQSPQPGDANYNPYIFNPYTTEFTFTCEPWSPDMTVLTPPVTVSFVERSSAD